MTDGLNLPGPDATEGADASPKNILIVDDSPVERSLALRLLTENLGCTANEADSGEEALLRVRMTPIDLLLTDLRMPDIDGLDLLRQVKEEDPLLPVVVMTGQGTEETAVAALQGGADGYITKRRLAADVVGVVRSVLGAAERGRSRARLLQHLTRQSMEFELENDLKQIAPLQKMIVESCHQMGVVTERDRVRVAVAIEEAVSNAMIHGNLEVSSKLREELDNSYEELIRQRQQDKLYSSRRVHLKCELTRELARVTIEDSGPGFEVSEIPDAREVDRISLPSGRGILLMRSFMDAVNYNETGNRVTLVKFREETTETPASQEAQVPVASTGT